MNNPYEILGISSYASNEEIDAKYTALKSEYNENRFKPGEEGNEAARKLTELESAYDEIRSMRITTTSARSEANDPNNFSDVSEAIRSGDLNGAQMRLDAYSDRNAEWHYMQSHIYYKKNWLNESKKQLEIAVSLDGANPKYQKALQDLNAKLAENNERVFTSGSTQTGSGRQPAADSAQMGGDALASCCTTWLCCQSLSCLCR